MIAYFTLGVIAGIALCWTTVSYADAIFLHQTPVYKTVNTYDNVQVCTPGRSASGADVLTGAILGGVIGNNVGSGDGAGGAALGALFGLLDGDTPAKCRTESRVTGSYQQLTGYNVTMNIDGRAVTKFFPRY